MTNKVVHVAVGVVLDQQQNILISQRQAGQHLAGFWEFPGGKIEAGELCEQALFRELDEELGIQVKVSEALIVIEHQYAEKQVKLDVRLVTQFSGVPSGREGQAFKWVPASQLGAIEFPAANKKIIAALQQRLCLRG
ncbi:8-oxo-dGTP diphosphatase MutT [Teredinibacter franksiae]|uniref:8-oxo-dGTP diphosphatase MutT n=1 Tax=Teredinibacter franksiae TaxID=2761453 RepID=UPI0028AFE431|nr:8-oxo-dGTP diphosphatase MutT [Teredinibacter franksiae]